VRYITKALRLIILGRYDEAVAVCDRILSLEPDYETNIQALQGKASGLFNSWRYDDAIGIYDKILSIVPSMVNANISKVDALFNLGRYDDAIGRDI
jgi:tetratricopeptide (TPR) repeat protein